MAQLFVGAEAIASARLTRAQLRWNYTAVHPGIYIPNSAGRTLFVNTVAAWRWTGRKGIIAGRAAAALHGARSVDASTVHPAPIACGVLAARMDATEFCICVVTSAESQPSCRTREQTN